MVNSVYSNQETATETKPSIWSRIFSWKVGLLALAVLLIWAFVTGRLHAQALTPTPSAPSAPSQSVPAAPPAISSIPAKDLKCLANVPSFPEELETQIYSLYNICLYPDPSGAPTGNVMYVFRQRVDGSEVTLAINHDSPADIRRFWLERYIKIRQLLLNLFSSPFQPADTIPDHSFSL